MSIPLSLGVPKRRDGNPLLAGLFEVYWKSVDCAAADVAGALADRAPHVVYVEPLTSDSARELTAAGHHPGLRMSEPPERIADFLAVLAHSNVGFVARAADAGEVLAILAATVAALCGEDVRAALAEPAVESLTSLHPDAATAVREVLLAIEVEDPVAVLAALEAAGLG